MRQTEEDASVWIGYADFLTTLTILFFILAVAIAAQHASDEPEPALVVGAVHDSESAAVVDSLAVTVGTAAATLEGEGRFAYEVEPFVGALRTSVTVSAPGYGVFSTLVDLAAGDTTVLDVALRRERTVEVAVLPGDALFERNEYSLKPEAISRIVEVVRSLSVGEDEVIVVQGHTDDVPFPPGAGKDNWVLSGERAAAAAQVLTASEYGVGLAGCRVAIMGFGPSRPIERVRASDDRAEKARKRARNRRIEFRKLRGADLTTGQCANG